MAAAAVPDVDPDLFECADEPRAFFDLKRADAFDGEFVHERGNSCVGKEGEACVDVPLKRRTDCEPVKSGPALLTNSFHGPAAARTVVPAHEAAQNTRSGLGAGWSRMQ